VRLLLILWLAGCADTHYTPLVVARGELILSNHDGLQLHAGGHRVARAMSWRGLDRFVRCVPRAHENAAAAERDGSASVALAWLGGSFGVLALGGLVGVADQDHLWEWLAGGVASGVLGLAFAASSRMLRNRANGHAVDAMNFYNDAVGSLGATCDDLRYPPAAGPASSEATSPTQ